MQTLLCEYRGALDARMQSHFWVSAARTAFVNAHMEREYIGHERGIVLLVILRLRATTMYSDGQQELVIGIALASAAISYVVKISHCKTSPSARQRDRQNHSHR